MSSHDRPAYDQKLLEEIGFIKINAIVLRRREEVIQDFVIICEKSHAD